MGLGTTGDKTWLKCGLICRTCKFLFCAILYGTFFFGENIEVYAIFREIKI